MGWIIPVKKKITTRRKMPRQKPGLSEQSVGTPWEFIDAVEERYGPLTIDLASDKENAKAPMWIPPERDSLKVKWAHSYKGNMWLNPEFGSIPLWARKCAREWKRLRTGDRIFLLVPASIGAHWFWDYVYGKALVLPLSPRLTFVGHKHPYPKDLMLCVYGEKPGLERWVWKTGTRARAAT